VAYGCEIRLQPYSPSLFVSFPRCLSLGIPWGPTVACSIPFWSSFACHILAAVVVSSPRRLIASSPCRLALPPRRIVAVVAVASPPRIRRSLARISPPPWARVGPLRRARPRPRVSAPVAHGAEPGRGSHTTNANHLVFRAGSPATSAVQPPPVGARRWSPSSSCSGWC
jgi:hypothetical protein